MGKTPRSRSQCQKNSTNVGKVLPLATLMWNIKAIVIIVQKLFARLKFKKKWVKLQGQAHRVKNNGFHGKILSQVIRMWNTKTLALTVQKVWARIKFLRAGQNDRVSEWQNDRQDKNNMLPDLRSRGHKNCSVFPSKMYYIV